MIDVGLLHDAVRGVPGFDLRIDRERLPGAGVAPDIVIPFSVPLEPASVFFEDSLHFGSEIRHLRCHAMRGPGDARVEFERHFITIRIAVFV